MKKSSQNTILYVVLAVLIIGVIIYFARQENYRQVMTNDQIRDELMLYMQIFQTEYLSPVYMEHIRQRLGEIARNVTMTTWNRDTEELREKVMKYYKLIDMLFGKISFRKTIVKDGDESVCGEEYIDDESDIYSVKYTHSESKCIKKKYVLFGKCKKAECTYVLKGIRLNPSAFVY